jgi:hypothetical protein
MAISAKRAGSEEVGWSELRAANWAAARSAFETALTDQETPGALEGLSWAAWWLDDAKLLFEACERAYRLYKRDGNAASAARMCTWLASDTGELMYPLAANRAHELISQVALGLTPTLD